MMTLSWCRMAGRVMLLLVVTDDDAVLVQDGGACHAVISRN